MKQQVTHRQKLKMLELRFDLESFFTNFLHTKIDLKFPIIPVTHIMIFKVNLKIQWTCFIIFE